MNELQEQKTEQDRIERLEEEQRNMISELNREKDKVITFADTEKGTKEGTSLEISLSHGSMYSGCFNKNCALP